MFLKLIYLQKRKVFTRTKPESTTYAPYTPAFTSPQKSEQRYTVRTSKDPPTERPNPSTYFYPQPTATSEQPQTLTGAEKLSTNYNKNSFQTSNGENKAKNPFQSVINRDETPQVGVTIVDKSPVTVETEDESLFSSFESSDEDENEVITFWVDDPSDIPNIINAGSFFDDSPAALLEKFSRSDEPSLRHIQEGENLQEQESPKAGPFSTSQGHQNAPFSSSTTTQVKQKEEKSGTSLRYPKYATSHSHNSYHTSTPNSHDKLLTKSTKSQSLDYSTSDDAINDNINPHEFHGGLIDESSYGRELQSEGRTNEALDYPDPNVANQYEFHGGFVPSQRGGRYQNEIIKYNEGQDRNKRKSQLYFSDVYQQDNTLKEEDEGAEEVVEDDFLEEGEYESTGEADAAFEQEFEQEGNSLFSPDAPYRVYGQEAQTEDAAPSYQESEEEENENSYVEEVEEEEEVEEPATEPPKKVNRYKSTSSINQYKSTSSINKYKSSFEIKDSNRVKKPEESTSEVPTIYIKYSETVPKSENSPEENNYSNEAAEEEDAPYRDASSNSVFHSGEGFGGKFVTPQNFQIPQEFRTFLSKPPSWINMENW